MFTKTLLPDTFRAIKLVSKIPTMQKAYLAGGTALALHLGHRISVDLDFFTNLEFNETTLSSELSSFPGFKEDGVSWRTVWGYLGETKFSIFYYKYPLIDNTVEFQGIHLAGKKDIAAMKVHAIEERGTRRDFIDLFYIAKEYSLDEILGFYEAKYGVLDDHLYSILRALAYFEDAEVESQMPNMIEEVDWEQVKKYFEKEAVRLGKIYLLG